MTAAQRSASSGSDGALTYRPVALVDLLDRVLATGVVITGDITLAIADIDLVRISLRALIASVGALAPPEPPAAGELAPRPVGQPDQMAPRASLLEGGP